MRRIKGLRVLVFALLLLIIMGMADVVIVEYVDAMKIRNILAEILCIVGFLLLVFFWKKQKTAASQVTKSDIFMVVTLAILIIISFVFLRNGNLRSAADFVPGNNGYSSYYTTNAKGYGNLGTALENSIEQGKRERDFSELEEIYRMQAGENISIYYIEDEMNIVEFTFLKQDDLYYLLGYRCAYVLLDDKYTVEETIREDMVSTMRHGSYDELEAPAWGISADEKIYSMTINGKKADDIILINEKDGKKYYFWIISDIGEIKTADDVKAAKIEMNRLQ